MGGRRVSPAGKLPAKPELPLHEKRRCPALYSETELTKYISEYCSDCIVEMGFSERLKFSNIRIVAYTIASSLGIASIFINPPKDRFILSINVILFFLLTGAVMLYEQFVIQCAAIAVYDYETDSKLFLDVKFHRKSACMAIGLRRGHESIYKETSVGEFFTDDGEVVTDSVYEVLSHLVETYRKDGFENKKMR